MMDKGKTEKIKTTREGRKQRDKRKGGMESVREEDVEKGGRQNKG